MRDTPQEESMVYIDLRSRMGGMEAEVKRLREQLKNAFVAANHNEERVGVWRDRYERMTVVADASLESGVSRRSKVQREYNAIIKEVQDERGSQGTSGEDPDSGKAR